MGVPMSLRLPSVTGPHPVGCTDIMVGLGKEGSFFRFYYPSASSCDQQHPLWAPSTEYTTGLVSSLGMESKAAQYGASLILGRSRIPVSWNGPILHGTDKRPLIIFSHGLGAFRAVYSSLCSELASHGFLVAAVEHKDGSACATYYFEDLPHTHSQGHPQKVWVPFRKVDPGMKEFYLRNYQLHQRATECVKAVRVLENINAGMIESSITVTDFQLHNLTGRIDLSRVAIMGHSFGGASALLSLVKDDIFRCAIGLDAWMFPLENAAYPNIQKPTLFINNENFQTASSIQKMKKLNFGQEGAKIVTVLGSVHQSPTDFAFMTGYMANKILGPRGTIDPQICLEATVASALSFLYKHLVLPEDSPKLLKLSGAIRDHLIEDVSSADSSKL
ncbi:platelet-activating factor acetylhydrolase 2, cytoplasmic [Spea bombifrons]|uniref:platelet-activating factor acetylhydrolase 2, cytoplasmic n=1 Tax=Spea bombifrons TaxID=233779 RepID=UPI00234B56D2|nr:platelet-activating factor acetylhydrolase 2, cytoplasmic [Spea bombifrons]